MTIRFVIFVAVFLLSYCSWANPGLGEKCAQSFWYPSEPQSYPSVRFCAPVDKNGETSFETLLSSLRDKLSGTISSYCEREDAQKCSIKREECGNGECILDKSYGFALFSEGIVYIGGEHYPPVHNCPENEKPWVARNIKIVSVLCYCKCCPIPVGGQGRGIRSPSQCVVGCPCEKLVNLDNFITTPQKKGVLLRWETASEVSSEGFKIWRGIPDLSKHCGCSTNMEDYKQVTMIMADEEDNSLLIPAKGSKMSGAKYSYLDKNVKPGIPYCYVLEDIDSNGESKFYFEYISFTPDAELEGEPADF